MRHLAIRQPTSVHDSTDPYPGRRGVFELRLGQGAPSAAYLRLPTYPEEWPFGVSSSVRLEDLIGAYEGPEVVLDFDEKGYLVGVEFATQEFANGEPAT